MFLSSDIGYEFEFQKFNYNFQCFFSKKFVIKKNFQKFLKIFEIFSNFDKITYFSWNTQILNQNIVVNTIKTSAKPHATQEVYPRGMKTAYLLGIPLGMYLYLLGCCTPRGIRYPRGMDTRLWPKSYQMHSKTYTQEVCTCNPRHITRHPRCLHQIDTCKRYEMHSKRYGEEGSADRFICLGQHPHMSWTTRKSLGYMSWSAIILQNVYLLECIDVTQEVWLDTQEIWKMHPRDMQSVTQEIWT